MSLITFTLEDDHIKLVQQLDIAVDRNDDSVETPIIYREKPFGSDEIYNDMFLILYGKPVEDKNIDFNAWEGQYNPWDAEQLENMKKLLGELPYALDIILYTGSFETGIFKRKTYMRDWKKIG